ncbi:MAG TPA: energy-coupling factor transporter ATPase [Bacillota bacterium]|nr:energy-coupling factor transporter ATPase [Bacillota bacterium]HNT02822.1 energy-coupling factor transporter ATPase [Bacillota bacterium]HPA53877.1 energy-coupling factor transporter ATPase [Bacillota bacterium]HPL98388.1 energy-coupling factor transporter ATPase [Bacillota bacterium]HPW40415.1 energy-coupling factor transporter ATPase [Bacillota bacterium]
MALLQINNFNFTYAGDTKKVLSGINLTVGQGEFIVLCGPSGSGKTTLLRNIKREISPAGIKTGDILYKGMALDELKAEVSAKEIGMVFQEPDSQIVMDTVIHELAFSLENFGYAPDFINKKLSEMAAFFGLTEYLHKPVQELSGGQKQVINICSVMLTEPKLLLLDEPTSQLDPVAARELISLIHQINREFSVTVIISEHRLEELFSIADRVVYMDGSIIKYCNSPDGVSKEIMEAKDEYAVKSIPPIVRLFFSLSKEKGKGPGCGIPMSVREGKQFMQNIRCSVNGLTDMEIKKDWVEEIINCKDIGFRYAREEPMVLEKLTLKIMKGEFMAILGGNGSGKSTLLLAMAGLITPQQGSICVRKKNITYMKQSERNGIIGYVAQNPLLHFTLDTVKEELEFALQNSLKTGSKAKMEELIELFGLKDLTDRHPYDLSGGQQQNLAVACALIHEPEILLIDEPTKGLDSISKEKLAELLKSLKGKGTSVVMATHDIEFAAHYAEKCAMLFDGSISDCAEPSRFFSGNYFYTTSINRAVRDYLPHAITYEDVIRACL